MRSLRLFGVGLVGFLVGNLGTALATRNGSGTYSLPAGNPVVTRTAISTTWANNTLNDVATEMTDSLDRSGKGCMLAPMQASNGAASTPSITFCSELATGMYRAGAADIRMQVGGVQQQSWGANGSTFPRGVVITQAQANTVGLSVTAGSSNANGVNGIGTGTGQGVNATSGGSGAGLYAASVTGPGVFAVGNATRPPLSLFPQTDPSTPSNGDMWITSSKVKAQVGGAAYVVAGSPAPVTASMLNSWVADVAPRYWINANNIVCLDGSLHINANGSSVVAMTLGAGYPPASTHKFTAPDTSSTAASVTGVLVTIASTGDVTIAEPGTNNHIVSLDGICFPIF